MFNSCIYQKMPDRFQRAFVCLFTRMRSVEHGNYAVKHYTDFGTVSFFYMCAACSEKTLNIRPQDRAFNRIVEDILKCFSLFSIHFIMISIYDSIVKEYQGGITRRFRYLTPLCKLMHARTLHILIGNYRIKLTVNIFLNFISEFPQ